MFVEVLTSEGESIVVNFSTIRYIQINEPIIKVVFSENHFIEIPKIEAERLAKAMETFSELSLSSYLYEHRDEGRPTKKEVRKLRRRISKV